MDGILCGRNLPGELVRWSGSLEKTARSRRRFPPNEEQISRFASAYLRALAAADVLGIMQSPFEAWLLRRAGCRARLCALASLEPFFTAHPWSCALAGRRVLVVHPFAETIRSQYSMRREQLFTNPRMLPGFELMTVGAPQTMCGQSGGFACWDEALESLQEEVAAKSFDVAIVGCGAYGLPLAEFIKSSLGRAVIHLGGSTQILFGVSGGRWRQRPESLALMNEHWRAPAESGTSSGMAGNRGWMLLVTGESGRPQIAVTSDSAAPIIFIHYGYASYLRRALRAARHSNPHGRIILLGDESNRNLARGLGEFYHYEALACSAKAREFGEVFQVIEGAKHRFTKPGGTARWLRFVFQRWFCLEEFAKEKGIEGFWTFDSDTLILADLSTRADRYAEFDVTTQCRDNCLNGWIGSRRIVKNYTSCILDLFKDECFLESQHRRLQAASGLAFTEMDAFREFRCRSGVRAFHAAQPLLGEFFDDALAFDADYEPSPAKIGGKITIKRLWRSNHHALYARPQETDQFARLLTANFSWLPDYLWKKLGPFSLTPAQDLQVQTPALTELRS